MNPTLQARHPLPKRPWVPGLFLLTALVLWACQPYREPSPTPTARSGPTPTAAASATDTHQPAPNTPAPSTPTPPGCTETAGQVEKDVIETDLLTKPLRYNVYLPPCYSAETGRRYPVLYLLHGQNFDEQQWLRIGAASAADELIQRREMPAFIIVFPYDHSFKQPTEYRFEEALLTLLIPQIDANYRTRPEASQRAIGGLSRGGAWAIRLGTRHPDVFGAIGGHSPAIFYSDMDTLPVRLRDADKDNFPRIFLDAGDKDVEYANIVQFEAFLNQMNIPHEWHSYLGFHDEKYWSAHVEEYLRWYADGWQ